MTKEILVTNLRSEWMKIWRTVGKGRGMCWPEGDFTRLDGVHKIQGRGRWANYIKIQRRERE